MRCCKYILCTVDLMTPSVFITRFQGERYKFSEMDLLELKSQNEIAGSILFIKPFITEFMKLTLPFMNLDLSIDASRGFSLK